MTSRASNNIPPSLRKVWNDLEKFNPSSPSSPKTTEVAEVTNSSSTATTTMAHTSRAIVSHDTLESGGWKMEETVVRSPGEGELLIEMAATGVCHTDILIGGLPNGASPIAFYPRVLGHEGSGYVKEIGPGVTVAQPGDPVLLSFDFCDKCEVCKDGGRSYCPDFVPLNFGGPYKDFGLKSKGNETDIGGRFFGQSSFAALSIVKQCSIVNAKDLVKSKEELQLFAPLGCGIQTGSGTVVNTAQAGPKDTVLIMGLGGVGLSAVMGAKVCGAKRIIGLDRVQSRLDFAKELGCTDIIDGSKLPEGKSLVEVVKEMCNGLGPTITVDTTGVPALTEAAIQCTRPAGKILQVGSPPFDAKLELPTFEFMISGKQFIGAIEGNSYPPEYVPRMIQWYREGRFPVDKLVKFMPADQFMQATKEMHDGVTIKPVLVW